MDINTPTDPIRGSRETTMTEPPPSRYALRGSTLSSLLSFRRDSDKPPPWPSPEQSIGPFICRSGKNSIWEACGPARDSFRKMAPEIKGYLDDDLEPISSWVTWSMYMIGRSKCSASPTVLFCCKVLAHRREVQDIIKNSGILGHYPGIKTGHMAEPPGFQNLVPLAGDYAPKPVMFTFKVDIPQRRLIIPGHLSAAAESPHRATLGGTIKIRDRFLFTTARHSFCKSPEPPFIHPNLDQNDDVLSLDGDSDTDDSGRGGSDQDPIAHVDSTIPPPFASETKNEGIMDEAEHSQLNQVPCLVYAPSLPLSNLQTQTDLMPSERVGLFMTPRPDSTTGIDYALIELGAFGYIAENQFVHPRTPERCVLVRALAAETKPSGSALVITSRGTILGNLSETPLYARGPGGTKFQRMITAVFEDRLEKGDSGSWVVDADTGDLHGHVVAGSPELGTALILPFSDVFEDISRHVGIVPTFPVPDQNAGNDSFERLSGDEATRLLGEASISSLNPERTAEYTTRTTPSAAWEPSATESSTVVESPRATQSLSATEIWRATQSAREAGNRLIAHNLQAIIRCCECGAFTEFHKSRLGIFVCSACGHGTGPGCNCDYTNSFNKEF
ncbi:hypothetical protein PG993_011039 [Apiospora rasikravindrae]|uniref:Uncharacterized protein n=1 Tax=Apiospora rasikravindrae TaxID=990691 RepID=A0ABR1SD79_9PEZI